MRITAIETIRADFHDNLVWLHIETDAGLIGLGETFFYPAAVETHLHEVVAPMLLGADATRIGQISTMLMRTPVGYASSGTEMRAASAVDIALWDLMGQQAAMPIHRLLGGLAREKIRIYNTCAGPHYVTRTGAIDHRFGLDDGEGERYDDLRGFMERPAELARDLLSEGITGMKIWPFDFAAEANGRMSITTAQIEEAVRPFRLIREAVGRQMDLMVELHSMWDIESAKRIFRALEPLEPTWFEDPIRMDDAEGLAELARFTRIPILASETTAPKESFRRLLEQRAVGVVSFDAGWCGGISEAQKIIALADSWQIPIAPHDCTGPVGFVAGTHLSLSARNAMIQETVRAYTRGWYGEVVTALPRIEQGMLYPMEGPGLGLALQPEFLGRMDVKKRRSS
ncbi:MAG: mandelate racemase/muconate lactonizing enzyme family protein [Alphaproteobacteria bacterium]|nr:mandelate racemase/muconate lactonizing enzyme family protein [Alphaproteobacteria bacterium]